MCAAAAAAAATAENQVASAANQAPCTAANPNPAPPLKSPPEALKVHLVVKETPPAPMPNVAHYSQQGNAEALAAAVAAELAEHDEDDLLTTCSSSASAQLRRSAMPPPPPASSGPAQRSTRLPSFETLAHSSHPSGSNGQRPGLDLAQLQLLVFDLDRRLRQLEAMAALGQVSLVSPGGPMTAAMAAAHLAREHGHNNHQSHPHPHHPPPPPHFMVPSVQSLVTPLEHNPATNRLFSALGSAPGSSLASPLTSAAATIAASAPETPSDRPARPNSTFPTRADFDDVCGPVLQLTANPNAVQQNTMVRYLARRYPAVDNREILSAMRRWFRKRREEMSQRIYSSCRRHIAEQPANRHELTFFMERLRADVPLIDRIRREAHMDITEEREARAFTLDKVENYLQKQMEATPHPALMNNAME